MTSGEIRTLADLEWRRTRSAFALLLVGYLLLVLLAWLVPPARAAVVAAKVVLPALAGLILGAGLIAEDAQQGTLPGILALPISRERLWAARCGIRLALLAALLAVWLAGWLLSGSLWFDLDTDIPPTWFLVGVGLVSFAAATLCSQLTRSPFEAALLTWVLMPILMAVVQAERSYGGMLVLYMAAGLALSWVALDLFRRREPIASRALWRRAGGWTVILVAVLAVASWMM